MNTALIAPRNYFVIYGLPALVILTSVVIALSPLLQQNPALITGITYDLALTSPLLYLLLIWKKKIPKITAVPLFVLGIVLASFLLPANSHLNLLTTWILPIVEVAVISTICYKIYQFRKAYKAQNGGDFLELFRNCGEAVLGSRLAATILAMEAGVIHYALFNWKKPSLPTNAFSYHIKSGAGITLMGLITALLVETIALHFIANIWSSILAWILTGSSVYFAIQLVAHLKALSRRPILLQKQTLKLKYGLFSDAEIDFSAIESVEFFKATQIKEEGVKKIALLGDFEGHNIRLKLNQAIPVIGAYGITKSYHTFLFFVDEKESFKAALEEKMVS